MMPRYIQAEEDKKMHPPKRRRQQRNTVMLLMRWESSCHYFVYEEEKARETMVPIPEAESISMWELMEKLNDEGAEGSSPLVTAAVEAFSLPGDFYWKWNNEDKEKQKEDIALLRSETLYPDNVVKHALAFGTDAYGDMYPTDAPYYGKKSKTTFMWCME